METIKQLFTFIRKTKHKLACVKFITVAYGVNFLDLVFQLPCLYLTIKSLLINRIRDILMRNTLCITNVKDYRVFSNEDS